MVAFVGPLATISCELRQARKGATVTVDSGAGVWLALAASIFVQIVMPMPQGLAGHLHRLMLNL